MSSQPLSDLGERGLIQAIARYFGRAPAIRVGAGDDAAVLALPAGELVATTDLLFEDVHFSERTTAAFDVGWRAATANLSDLAAMGATPVGVLIGLGLPPETPVSWIEELYRGFTACADPHGAFILGGDTCRAKNRTVAVTALGVVAPHQILRRSAALPGDLLIITGKLGASRAGLAALLNPECYTALDRAVLDSVIYAHRHPVARLEVPALVWQVCDRAAAMDTSDGLLDAVTQVCEQSNCGAILSTEALPIDAATQQVAGADAVAWALTGGEDFELLIALPAVAADSLLIRLATNGLTGTIVGTVTAEKAITDRAGQPITGKAFEHFCS